MQVSIEVCRRDGTTVARVSPIVISDEATREDANRIRTDAKRMSAVYGAGFYVEVWAWFPHLGGDAYHRAYVAERGRLVCAVGF